MLINDEIMISILKNPRGYSRGASAVLRVNGAEEIIRLPVGKRIFSIHDGEYLTPNGDVDCRRRTHGDSRTETY